MSDNGFRISYQLLRLGALDGVSAQQLSLLDITNYSLEGDLEIATQNDKLLLIDVPLLEVFHAIRQTLKIVPLFTRSAPYPQMFREARTVFTVESDAIVIEHQEIAALRARSGAAHIRGSYVDFCVSFGAAAKSFVRDLQTVTPSLFDDDKSVTQFADLFVGAKIKDVDTTVYSVI